MWWFIVTDGLLFAGFLASYGYARILAFRWPDQSSVFSLPYIAAMTFVLISSSATMASAVQAAREGRRSVALRFVLLTTARRRGLPRHAGLRVAAPHRGRRAAERESVGRRRVRRVLLPADRLSRHARADRRHRARDDGRPVGDRADRRPDGVEMAGLYWHFVDLVWVFIFTLFYLV